MFNEIPLSLYAIADVFIANQQPIYLVGPAVRNSLLSLPTREYDLCGPMRPEAVTDLFTNTPGFRVLPHAPRFGILNIGIEDRGRWAAAEYTAFRKDSYRIGHSMSPVEFTTSIQEDAMRRDYTINAIYYDLHAKTIVDPANGMADIQAKVIRTASVDPIAVLGEDPLRILRLIRLSAELRFSIEEGLWLTAQRMASGLLDASTASLSNEILRLLLVDLRYPQLPNAKEALSTALTKLLDMRAYSFIMPGWEDAVQKHIPLCSLTAPILTVRMAALLHHGRGEQAVRGLLGSSGLSCPKEMVDRVVLLIRHTNLWHEGASNAEIETFAQDYGYGALTDLIALRKAMDELKQESIAPEWQEIYDNRRKMQIPDPANRLALDGWMISRLAGDSPSLAQRLRALAEEHVNLHPQENHPDALTRFLTLTAP